ncbi:hypothetical protein [Vibrio mediterranei]
MLELLIGLVVTIAVGYFIVKGYRPACTGLMEQDTLLRDNQC